MQTFLETVELEKQSCGKCGGIFALNKSVTDHARANAGGFHCPYCQTRWSWNESEADKLRKQLVAANCATLKERQAREAVEAENIRMGIKLARVHRGVCPCCKRTFQNLQRHMATKHKQPV